MKEFTEEYLDNIRDIIARADEDAARAELQDMHPADVAELYQDLNVDQAEYLFKLLDEETRAAVLMELDEEDRHKLLEGMSAQEIAKQYIDYLDTDEAVDLIQELDEEDREEVLSLYNSHV